MNRLGLYAVLLVTTVAARGQTQAPAIFHVSPTAHAGDIIYLQGSGFGTAPLVQFSYNSSNWISLKTLTTGNNALTTEVPIAGQPSIDLITVRVSADGKTWSAPSYINQAHIMHFGTGRISPGGSFRAFGRNLKFLLTPAIRFVDMAGGASLPAVVDASASTAYELSITAPAGIIPGHSYNVYVSNGYNGKSSSGGETAADQTLLGMASGTDYWNLGVPWAAELNFYNNVFNVQTDSRLSIHAAGDGTTDDRSALQQAIWAANASGGGVVYLPPGNYKIGPFTDSCALGMSPRVVIAGAGVGVSTISYGYGTPPQIGGYAFCFSSPQNGLVDLNLTNVNETGQWEQSALALGCKELFLQRVNWDLNSAQWLVMQNSDELAIENSTITQSLNDSYLGPLELSGSTHFTLRNNSISYAAWGMDFGNMQDGIFEGNTVTRNVVPLPDSDNTHVIAANFVTNLAILNNQFVLSGGFPMENRGETILSEGGGPVRTDEFRGVVSSADTASLTDTSQTFPAFQTGIAVIAIVNGTGEGQWRTITAVSSDNHTLTVDRPWTVEPANGSHYATFDWSAANWTIAGNIMTNNSKGIELFDASSRDILITGNTLTDNSGIMISPDQGITNEFNVVYGIQIVGNSIRDTLGKRPAYVGIIPREDNQTTNFGTAVLGVEVKGNVVEAFVPNTSIQNSDDEKAVVEGFNCYWDWQTLASLADPNAPAVLDTVFQGNTAINSSTAYYLNSGAYETAIQNTILQNVGGFMRDDTVPGATHSSVDTVAFGTMTDADLGNSTQPGFASFDGTAYTIVGGGSDITSSADSFNFLSRPLSGPDVAFVKVISISETNSAAKAGLMFRDTTSVSSIFADIVATPADGVVFQWRSTTGGQVQSVAAAHVTLPIWLSLTKVSNLYVGAYSMDGVFWIPLRIQSLNFTSNSYLAGVAVTSQDILATTTATFTGLSLSNGQ